MTLRQLAAEIGVSAESLPYRYFADKKTVTRTAHFVEAFNRHADALETAWEAHKDDPIGSSNAVGQAYVDISLDDT